MAALALIVALVALVVAIAGYLAVREALIRIEKLFEALKII